MKYQQTERQLDDENGQEPRLVAPQLGRVALDDMGRTAEALVVPEQRKTDDGIRNGGEHHRAAQGRADADVLLGAVSTEDHSHESDRAFGQRGAEGCKHGTGRRLSHAQLAAEPLDAVDEIFARKINRGCGPEEEHGCEHEPQKYTIRFGYEPK